MKPKPTEAELLKAIEGLVEKMGRAAHTVARDELRKIGRIAPAFDVPWEDAPDFVRAVHLAEARACADIAARFFLDIYYTGELP